MIMLLCYRFVVCGNYHTHRDHDVPEGRSIRELEPAACNADKRDFLRLKRCTVLLCFCVALSVPLHI